MEVCERSGVPAVGLFGESFGPMAELLARQAGIPRHRLSVFPGMLATASRQELADKARDVLTPEVMAALTDGQAEQAALAELTAAAQAKAGASAVKASEALLQVVFTGAIDEVQD